MVRRSYFIPVSGASSISPVECPCTPSGNFSLCFEVRSFPSDTLYFEVRSFPSDTLHVMLVVALVTSAIASLVSLNVLTVVLLGGLGMFAGEYDECCPVVLVVCWMIVCLCCGMSFIAASTVMAVI